MKNVINTEKVPIKLWLSDIEDGAMNQAKNLANLPFVFRHIALMPDCHQGYGMPIGGVMATRRVVVPNAVGVDIGCGMMAVQTSLEVNASQDTIKKALSQIRKLVPTGFQKHDEPKNVVCMPNDAFGPIIDREFINARKSLGTLGGGNHFIEIQAGSDGYIYLMIHSGSRNLGLQVAKHYNNLAVDLNEKWFSVVPKKYELAFLPLDSEEGQSYLIEMQYCVKFALANREEMMVRVKEAISYTFGDVWFSVPINIAHNYVAMEHHFGQNVLVHRKGAIKAQDGQFGIIPGSQGTASYIVEGKGNKESFESCSHGAGRKMGRKQAQKMLDLEIEKKRLDDIGVIHAIRNVKDLDEAPGAYKDISKVMENQSDLVNILVELKPLAVIKGD